MFKQIFAPLFRRPFDLFEDMIGVAATGSGTAFAHA